MPQNYEELLDLETTPVEFLDDSGDKDVRTRIRTYLGALKYTAEEMDHPIGSLSGGQKAKILLLKMSLSAANVLLLDEPPRNFWPLSGPVLRKKFVQKLTSLQRQDFAPYDPVECRSSRSYGSFSCLHACNTMRILLPSSSLETTSKWPRCLSTIHFAIERPRPVPW